MFVVACGSQASEPKSASPNGGKPIASESDASLPVAPTPVLPWWQSATPICENGELKRRNLSWGSVYWCVAPGVRVDQSLQSDLSRLARCVHESVSAFQEEPEADKLGAFLARAHESGLNAELCNAVRRDAEVRTYHGRRVLLQRMVETEGETELEVRYRFGCEGCGVAAETRAKVARP